jgi:hypothetical protein
MSSHTLVGRCDHAEEWLTMTRTLAGPGRRNARAWWSVGTVLVANGALVVAVLSGEVRQATGSGGGFVPIDFMLGPVGLGAIAVGLGVALAIAWRPRVTDRSPVTGIFPGIGATAIGWTVAVALDVVAALVALRVSLMLI